MFQRFLSVAVLAVLFTLPSLASADSLSGLSLPEDVKGCFAISKDGVKMACVGYTNGRKHLEVKEIDRRRLHRIFILGSTEEPMKVSATPKAKLTKIMKKLEKMGFVPIQVGTRDGDGIFRIPGVTCGLSLRSYEDKVHVESEYGRGEWLAKDGLRGMTSLASVSVDIDRSRIFLVLDHQTPEKDATIREFKVLRLQDLTQREDCGVWTGKKEKEGTEQAKN